MPAKISTMYYIHEFTKRLTQEFTVKEIMAVARLDDDDPTKIIYLRVKAFIPIDENIPCQIEDFNKGQVIFLKGKFVACAIKFFFFIKTPPPLAIMVIPSVRETKASPEYATTPPTISYDEFE
ncbi:unnamed protein product [Rhizophagus irregularis]|nr:unnamed protein product [Rhizophagus irregularis]